MLDGVSLDQLRTFITAVDEGMRLGYNWEYGPFELLDRIGVDAFIKHCEATGLEVPPLLRAAAGRSFYRVENGRQEYLTVAGDYAPVERAAGVVELEDIKRAQKPLA